MNEDQPEYWLQGPLPTIIDLLQPVAHALLQAQREINNVMKNFPDYLLWQTPAGLASPAFHLQHIGGVLNRLFTYADNKQLTEEQLFYLSNEGKQSDNITVKSLLHEVKKQVDFFIEALQKLKPETLTETRYVGRKKILSTQMGLLFHAAEHTMRHTGQLLVTVTIIKCKKVE